MFFRYFRIDPLTLGAVVVTHAHPDHLYALPALIHEASGPAARSGELNEAGHSTGAQAGEIAARAGVGTLFLCHFERSGDSTDSAPERMKSEAQAKFSGNVVIPEAFRRYRI